MKVICNNDKNMPEGAEVIKGNEYVVVDDFVNAHGQRAFILEGIKNSGTTPRGLVWRGYSAHRFSEVSKNKNKAVQFEYAMN